MQPSSSIPATQQPCRSHAADDTARAEEGRSAHLGIQNSRDGHCALEPKRRTRPVRQSVSSSRIHAGLDGVEQVDQRDPTEEPSGSTSEEKTCPHRHRGATRVEATSAALIGQALGEPTQIEARR